VKGSKTWDKIRCKVEPLTKPDRRSSPVWRSEARESLWFSEEQRIAELYRQLLPGMAGDYFPEIESVDKFKEEGGEASLS